MTHAKKRYVDGKATPEIADRLGRNQGTIIRLLVKRAPCKKQGRKAMLDESAMEKQEAKLKLMAEKADGKYEVTAAALKRAARANASDRTILDALHKHGIFSRHLREKPVPSGMSATGTPSRGHA